MKRASNATAHPIRAAILELLDGDDMTVPEIWRDLPEDATVAAVGYHLAVLQEADLVDRVGGLFRRT
ncbi:MAG TPA: helix-turn-helix domain-containing protein [Solirubrobacterales bacterium]